MKMKKLLLVSVVLLGFVFNTYAEQPDFFKNILNESLYKSVIVKKGKFDYDLYNITRCLKEGADPNWIIVIDPKKPEFKKTVLSHFVERAVYYDDPEYRRKSYTAVKMLFDHGAKLQHPYDDDLLSTPIIGNHYDLAKLLLDKGISASSSDWLNIFEREKRSSIEYAAQKGHMRIVKLLAEYGAEMPKNEELLQLRLIHLASHGSVKEIDDIINKGAEVNSRNKFDQLALVEALNPMMGDRALKKISYLLSKGANPNYEGLHLFYLLPTLHIATIKSKTGFYNNKNEPMPTKRIIELLLENGAHVSKRDKYDKTPLHYAAEYDIVIIAKLLLENGAKIMPKDGSGKTPLDYAESGEMIKLLKSYRAKER